MATYTVVKGDCLYSIASTYLGSGSRWTELADLNGISRSDPTIYVGQVINLDVSGTGTTEETNTSNKANITFFGLQAGTDSSIFAVWSWDKDNTDYYETRWYYYTDDSIWFLGSNSNVSTDDENQSIYSAPSNATRVKFKVKPVSKTYDVNGTDTSYWTAEWSTEQEYNISDVPPGVPSAPSVTIENYTLTATLDNLDLNATSIQFQVVADDSEIFSTGNAEIQTNHAAYSCTVSTGSDYKVRCRGVRGDVYGDWSEYSSNVGTAPAASDGITTIKAKTTTSVYLEWSAVTNAESYEIEYTTDIDWFDGSDQTSNVTGIEFNHYEKTGLETGYTYYFRVRAVNDDGSSAWSDIKSVVLGSEPIAPTTWSSTTVAMVGESVTLYWVHNSEDSSSQTYAELELITDTATNTITIDTTEEEDDDKTSSYALDTSTYTEGTVVQWRVRTAGVTQSYGEWSVQRKIEVYAPPTLVLSLTDASGSTFSKLTSFPLYISAKAGPSTQYPIGYHVTIIANESYDTVNNTGNSVKIKMGDEVYSGIFDTTENLLLQISANHVNLDNNISYTVHCLVSMNSGLTAEAEATFQVAWVDETYSPNARLAIDKSRLVAYVCPYCEDSNGDLVSNLTMSVYRREWNGSFTEIATGLNNSISAFVTDPHPALDFARYRIIAISNSTGAVSFYDMPGVYIGEPGIVLQWDEQWTSFDATDEDSVTDQSAWDGSMLKLPFNVGVTDDYSPDATTVQYIGRTDPVSYYGTQKGHTASWTTEIPKTDTETLYAVRRLAEYMGDVYVRESSGSGYWANVKVTYNKSYSSMVASLTLAITRVEGGM